MPKSVRHAWLSSNESGIRWTVTQRRHQGLTLIELLVTLLILSILAAAALPYAELTITRSKELELRRALRDVRTAIDRFHEDWRTGVISKTDNSVSDDGYPKSLQTLVEGVKTSAQKEGKHKYLRRIPADPFDGADRPPSEQWTIRGYQDEPDAVVWSGGDVYDVRSKSQRTALDGTHYNEW